MDGVSAASGVLAIASLAIELVGVIQEIREFVDKVAHAPTQQLSLTTQLKTLEALLKSVQSVSERDTGNGSTVFPESLRFAVTNCEDNLKSLRRIAQKALSATGGRGKLTKTLGAVKVALKDKDIKEIQQNLNHAVTILNSALAVSASDAQYRNANSIMDGVRTMINEVTLLRNNILAQKQVLEFDNEVKEQHEDMKSNKLQSGYALRASRRQTQTVTHHKSFLGTLTIRQVESTTSFDGDHQHRGSAPRTQTKTNWILLPSFLSRYIDFQLQSVSQSISRNLRVYNVIHERDPIWSICFDEDVRALRSYLENNRDKVDPFVVDKYGNSLFHATAFSKNHESCKLLLELSVDPTSVINIQGRDALYRLQPFSEAYPDKGIVPELTFRLILAHFPDCIEGSVFRFWDVMKIDHFEMIIETWVTQENINIFQDSPILCAMRCIACNKMYWPIKFRWIQAIQRLIKMGADIHRFSSSSKVSLLDEVMALTADPYDVPEMLQFWYNVLSSSGVKIIPYIKAEVDFYYANRPFSIYDEYESLSRRTVTLVIHDDGYANFGWEWWVDPEAPGYELAKEFAHCEGIEYCWHKGGPKFSDYDYEVYYKLSCEYDNALRLREERFWSKKAAKAAARAKKEQAKSQFQLPGAWID